MGASFSLVEAAASVTPHKMTIQIFRFERLVGTHYGACTLLPAIDRGCTVGNRVREDPHRVN